MRWAIVIGIDEYGDAGMRLSAVGIRRPQLPGLGDRSRWWRRPRVQPAAAALPAPRRPRHAASSGAVRTRPRTTSSPRSTRWSWPRATSSAERLYFYFAGHGITARVANRDESALVTPGFDELHTDHSLAVRSIAEYFETTPFADQFLFIDACRNIPWAGREFEVGRWPVPRRRDPGAPPVQQFILYATSPGHTAAEVGWPGEAHGCVHERPAGGPRRAPDNAKAWSWERNCYEVRWERLASFINERMKDRLPAGAAEIGRDWPVQIPQDTGTRGVANRDRDVPVVSFPSGRFPTWS